jgi:hypothetical protein
MSTNEESAESDSVRGEEQNLLSVVERFHARKFVGRTLAGVEKKAALKVEGAGSTKKQKKTQLKLQSGEQ